MARRRRINPNGPATRSEETWPVRILIGTVAVAGTGAMLYWALRLAAALEDR